MKKYKLKESVQKSITYVVMILLVFGGTTLISIRNRSLDQKKTEMSSTQISQNEILQK